MKVIEHLNKAKGKTLFSFEILPPLKGKSIDSIYESIDPLLDFKPNFIKTFFTMLTISAFLQIDFFL
jgi:methylenetetrahydrofolate reductase (NADPH)